MEPQIESKINLDILESVLPPVFRRYNPEKDYDFVISLCKECNISPPDTNIICAFVSEVEGQIVAFCSLLINHFVEPLVVKSNLPLITKVKISDGLIFMVGGVASYLGIPRLYFIAREDNQRFVNFVQRQFQVREFVESKIYMVEL